MNGNTKRTLLRFSRACAARCHSIALALTVLVLPGLLSAQTLQHRYSFTSDASDSVGGANGVLMGGATIVSNMLYLPGGANSGATNCSYVALPNGIMTNDTSITVECWVTDNAGSTWAEVWSFGDSSPNPPGSSQPGNGTYYLGLIPHSGPGDFRGAFNNAVSEIDVIEPSTPLPLNVEEYTVMTYDAPSKTARLFINGVQVAINTNVPADHAPSSYQVTTNNWIGRDQFGGDATFTGYVDELRIWNAAVSPLYLTVATAAGPDLLITNLTPTSVSVTVSNTTMVGAQTQQASLSANFPQISGVALTPTAATNWRSSNTNVLTVSSSGLITAVSGGTATVSATVGGTTGTSATITVSLTPPAITQQPAPLTLYVGESGTFTVGALGGQLSYQWSVGSTPIPGATGSALTLNSVALTAAGNYSVLVTNALGSTNSIAATLTVLPNTLVHRYSFNTDANDSVGGANGTLMGSAVLSNNAVYLPGGTTSGDPNGSYVLLPDGIVSNLTSITIETWVTDNAGSTWAEVYSFGDSDQGPGFAGNGTNYIGLIPHSGPGDMRAALRIGNEQDVVWPGTTLPLNTEEYVVLTYDFVSSTATLSLNGVQVGINTNIVFTPMGMGDTFNNWIGRDQFAGDQLFTGSVDELRIWDSAVSQVYQAVTLAAGPDVLVTNTTPTLLTVSVTNSTMVGGQSQQAAVTGNFLQASNVTVTAAASGWTSSNTNALTVNASGLIRAIGIGSATVSATVGGVTAACPTITVSASQPIITQGPVPASAYVGQSATFTVSAVGGQLTYQWSKNSSAISGATNTSVTLTNLRVADSGTVSVLVHNAAGQTNGTAALTVTEPALIHRWSFNTDANDSIGGANGTLLGNAVLSNNAVYLPGGTISTDPTSSYVQFPNGILTNLNSMTIEVWLTDLAGATWAEVVSFGDSTAGPGSAGQGTNYIAIIPHSGPGDFRAAFKLQNEQDVVWPATTLPLNVEEDVVLTYDDQSTTATLYVNGVQVGINTGVTIRPSDLGVTFNDWLARDQWPDPVFNGFVDELRIYAGPLPAADVANNHAGGPDRVFAPGSVRLTVAPSGGNLVISWPTGTLQTAPSVLGPWTSNNSAVSPYTVSATGGAQFFRIKVQ